MSNLRSIKRFIVQDQYPIFWSNLKQIAKEMGPMGYYSFNHPLSHIKSRHRYLGRKLLFLLVQIYLYKAIWDIKIVAVDVQSCQSVGSNLVILFCSLESNPGKL